MLGPLFKDTSGKGDIHLALSLATVAVAMSILTLVGVLSGLAPALRASASILRRPKVRVTPAVSPARTASAGPTARD